MSKNIAYGLPNFFRTFHLAPIKTNYSPSEESKNAIADASLLFQAFNNLRY
ncbi:hypothetical protein V6Z05_06235 [Leptospira venezuelensis]|uniref:hypothetical protein n=1 Tax=Leptospira venezuelensis TaxID=1958811 RepID=UPI0012FF7038|nr:hypothetical protein [Leptospira venezuelensis]